MQQQGESTVGMAAKTAPGVAVWGASSLGMTVDELIGVLTLTYLLLMISHHLWRHWVRPWALPRTARTRCTDGEASAPEPCDGRD